MNNNIKIEMNANKDNIIFSRGAIASFLVNLPLPINFLNEIKTVISEAVTNAIVHGYPTNVGEIVLESEIIDNCIHINVFDEGVGIEHLTEALEPFYTTKPDDERSGMGFTIMKSFMDEVKVESEKGKGTKVYMVKTIKADE